jgi:hypothetical protein
VTGVAPGVATLTASVQGFVGTTAVGVRDLTAQSSPAGFTYLCAVTWIGSRWVIVGWYGAILTSP